VSILFKLILALTMPEKSSGMRPRINWTYPNIDRAGNATEGVKVPCIEEYIPIDTAETRIGPTR
jgi:hypothetical protein